MDENQCFVCGFDNEHALEEHHIIPESIGGADTKTNTEWLCANCHRAISTMYSKWFFAKLWRIFAEMETPPELVRKNPPLGLQYNDEHELVPDRDDNFQGVLQAVKLVDRDLSTYEIADRTGVSPQTARKLRNNEEHRRLYTPFINEHLDSVDLSDWCE